MESRVWSKAEEKWAYILNLRGDEVHRLKVTGNMLTLKKNLRAVLEALEQGKAPADAGAKSVETIDAHSIVKAEVSPENNDLTLYGGADGTTKLNYATGNDDAGAILQEILAKSGRSFEPTQEAYTVFEALIGPVILGGLAGLFWMGVHQAAGEAAAGGHMEAHGRRAGLQRLLILVGETLGATGVTLLGAALLLLFGGWGVARLVKRPERTVWLPAPAAVTA